MFRCPSVNYNGLINYRKRFGLKMIIIYTDLLKILICKNGLSITNTIFYIYLKHF